MRQTNLFTKTTKESPKDEASKNAEFLIRGGFVDKLMAGVYSYLPLGLRVLRKIENIVREEMNKINGQELIMPALQPKENWQKTGRWETMDDLYKVKDKSDREFALGPTHEEVVVPLVRRFVNSYKNLPLAVYQFQNKFRMELRSKSGLLRGREFLMKDMYSFHLAEKDLDEYYEQATKAYFNIYERVGLKDKTYLTYASGGSFSQYSHEFQTITNAGEDTIYICQQCHLAVNKEIKAETPKCPGCQGQDFLEAKSIEVGNIFKLKTKFSSAFDLGVKDEKGEKREVIMGCYGIGLGRLLGTIVEVFNDADGIIWPMAVAPFQAHLLALGEDKGVAKKGDELYNALTKAGIEVLYDDRDLSAGSKLADSDLLGIPFRLILSEKTLVKKSVEVKRRGEKGEEIVPIKEAVKWLETKIKF